MINTEHYEERYPKSFSIWLMPNAKIFKTFKQKIKVISNHFGGPVFDPHVTLVSSFLGDKNLLIEKTKIMSKKIKPFNIYLDKIGYMDEFFRSLFMNVISDRNFNLARVLALNELNEFQKNNINYIPHMSLAYGNFSIAQKENMIGIIKELPNEFYVDNIFLAFNDEINLKWEIVKKFKLMSENA